MAAFVVTNLNDSGPGSLRQMVLDANAAAGPDTIDFAAGLAGTLTLTTGELVLTDDVTINGDTSGDDRADITISGNNSGRIFRQTLAGTDTLLQSLTLTNGSAAGAAGGAVRVDDGSLTIQDSTIQNSVSDSGGGVSAGSATTLTITNSLIAGNTASSYGGGIVSRGTVLISNTNIANNSSAAYGGGGLALFGTATLLNNTIVANHAITAFTATTGGGGIALGSSATISVSNTVFSDNTTGSALVENDMFNSIGGTLISNNNVFDDAVVAITSGSGNQFNVDDAGLGALQDNGGTVNTFAPDAGSPLINAGSNTAAASLATDANGNARIVGGTVDVGASEFVGVLTVTNLNDSGPGSLRDAVAAANLNADFNEIVFQAGLTGSIAVLSNLTLTNNVSINGDTNGDGDFDITLTDDDVGYNFFNVISVAAGGTAALTSLSISGVASAVGAGVVQNAGDLTMNYLVLANNHLGTGQSFSGYNYAPVLNSGILSISQTAFTENIVTGATARPLPFTPGGAGGSASASILNSSPGQVTAAAIAVIGGTATGGTGGAGSVTFSFPNPSTGLPGGNGGNASLGIMNGGIFSGTGNFVGAGTATAGQGGTGGTGDVGGTAPSGLPGLSSLTN